MKHRLLICILPALLTGEFLVSCVGFYAKDGNGGSTTFIAAGTDAESIDAMSTGFHAKNFNQSKGLKIVGDTVLKIWRAYLLEKGLEFLSGQYYTHQGKVVDSATTVKLEELRNAKSVADAEAQLEILKATPAP